MNDLRRYIRKLLLEKGEFRQWFQAGHGSAQFSNRENIDIKKWFHKNADQKSLQKLTYVHWAKSDQIFKLLQLAYKNGGKSRAEINTGIYNSTDKLNVIDLSQGEDTKIGLMVKGWVSMASNIDLDSGRMDGVTPYTLKNPKDRKLLQQQLKFGLNKRPNVLMVKDRIKDSMNGNGSAVYVGDTQILDAEDWTDALILKADDLKLQPNLENELEDFTLNWPEAFVDNWKPMAIVVHTNMQPDDWFELIDTELPLIDEDKDVWSEIYQEYIDYQAENIQYELDNDDEYELEDHEKRILQAHEKGDITLAFPYLVGWV